MESGLLLITGPYKINGIPLRRVNQAYCLPTSTKVNVAELSLEKIDDKFFAKIKAKSDKTKKNELH